MNPDPDVVHVWLAGHDVPEPVLGRLLEDLDPEERRRAAGFLRANDRRRFIVAHAAARGVLGAQLGVPADRIRWRIGHNGKPHVAAPATGIRVNLSHSGDLCAFALSTSRDVGVDVQRVSPGLDVAAMARRYFRPEELRFVLSGATPAARAVRFAQLWARKEAMVKAAGGRLLRGMPVCVLGGGVVEFDGGERAGAGNTYRITDLAAPDGFRLAVALSGAGPFQVVRRRWLPPVESRSDTRMHPQIRALRERRARAGEPALYTLSLDQARAADLASIRADGGNPEPVYRVQERRLPGPEGELRVRIYRPGPGGRLPVLLYYFGGGWTLGGIETADGICRRLANAAGALVVTVGYRLAPEHPFPAAVHDCHAALAWVAGEAERLGADPDRLAVGGDSAGGNLAAAVALLARGERGIRLAGQLLVYPNTDQLADDASLRENDDPWLFNRRSVAWYRGHYLRTEADAADPLASPLRAADLTGLPPALVITAELDPLRDQGEAYARRLAEAGVPVELTRYPGMAHGFFAMTGSVDAAGAATAQAARTLRSWFGLPQDPDAPDHRATDHRTPHDVEADR